MAEAPVILSPAVQMELEEAASGGIGKLKEHIERKNSEWKNIPLNIGITGESGVGKSSFINAIRGITADDKDGAPVGVVETTNTRKSYVHPENENMLFWDLPGIGTPKHPRTTYLEEVKFNQYDFFLILSAGRFREDDLWLIKEIQKLDKKFHFVRTQVGNDVKNDKKAHPQTFRKSDVIKKVRNDCAKQIDGLTEASVFLIDNYAPFDFDFNALTTTLIDEAPVHKKEAMILSMSVLTKGVLEKKLTALKSRIFKVSLISAAFGALPIPGLGAIVDGTLLLEEVKFYKTQFGLDDSTIKENARLLKMDVRALKTLLGLESLGLAETAKGLVQGMSCLAIDEVVETALPIAIPIIGSLFSAGMSYGTSVLGLRYFLNMCFNDALKINQELMKHVLN